MILSRHQENKNKVSFITHAQVYTTQFLAIIYIYIYAINFTPMWFTKVREVLNENLYEITPHSKAYYSIRAFTSKML